MIQLSYIIYLQIIMIPIIKQYKFLFLLTIKNEFFNEWAPAPKKRETIPNPERKLNPIEKLKKLEKIQLLITELNKLEWIELQKGNRNIAKNKILQSILNTLWYDISFMTKLWKIEWTAAIDWYFGRSILIAVALLQADLWISPNNWEFNTETWGALNLKLDEKLKWSKVTEIAREEVVVLKEECETQTGNNTPEVIQASENFEVQNSIEILQKSSKIRMSMTRLEELSLRIHTNNIPWSSNLKRNEELEKEYFSEIMYLTSEIGKIAKNYNWAENIVHLLTNTSIAYYWFIVSHESSHLNSALSKWFWAEIISTDSMTHYIWSWTREDIYEIDSAWLNREQKFATFLMENIYSSDWNWDNPNFTSLQAFTYLIKKWNLLRYSLIWPMAKWWWTDSSDITKMQTGWKNEIDWSSIQRNAIASILLSWWFWNILKKIWYSTSINQNYTGGFEIDNQRTIRFETAEWYIYLPEVETKFDYDKGITNPITFFYQTRWENATDDAFYSIRIDPRWWEYQFSVKKERYSYSAWTEWVGGKIKLWEWQEASANTTWNDYEVWYSRDIKLPEIKIEIPENIRALYEKAWLNPDEVEVPKQDIITQLQIMALANWDKVNNETRIRLWLITTWWKIIFPEQVLRELGIWAETTNPKEIQRYITKKLIIIRWRLSLLFDEKWSANMISSSFSVENIFENWSLLDSMRTWVYQNTILTYATALFGKNFWNRTIEAWSYWTLWVTGPEFWVAIRSINWNEDWTGAVQGLDLNYTNLIWSNLGIGSESKRYEDTTTYQRIWFLKLWSFLTNILGLQPITSQNPWQQVTDIMNWEMFMKYWNFFQTVTKNKEDAEIIWSIIITLQELSNQWRWIFLDDILGQMRYPKNLKRLNKWLKENKNIISNKPKWNIFFKDFRKDWKNRYYKDNNNFEIYWDKPLSEVQEYNDKWKYYSRWKNYNEEYSIMDAYDQIDSHWFPKTVEVLEKYHIELEIDWEITPKQASWFAYFIKRLWKQTHWLEKIKYRKIRIIDEKIFQRDVAYEDTHKTIIEIEKNVLEELEERWWWEINNILNRSNINITWLDEHQARIIAIVNVHNLDLRWIQIVSNNDPLLKRIKPRWWWWMDVVTRDPTYDEIKSTYDWRLILSENYIKKLIEWLNSDNSWIINTFLDYIKKTNLKSLSKFDKDLSREMRTQDRRSAEASRVMWRSTFLDYRPHTEIYTFDNNTQTEYQVYDVMNRFQYSMTVILTNDDNIIIEITKKAWEKLKFNISSLANSNTLNSIRKEYPWVLKILLWSAWIRPNGESDTLSWIIPLMIQYRKIKK